MVLSSSGLIVVEGSSVPTGRFVHSGTIRPQERWRRRVRLGLQIPQGYFNEFEGWEPARAVRRVIEICQLAERRGFDSVWFGEHVTSKWGGESIAFDCFTLATAVAAVGAGVPIRVCLVEPS